MGAARAADRQPAGSDDDALGDIETQAAVLVRNFELLRRRTPRGELDRADYLLLRALESLGPSDINTLAAALGLDPSTAGRQVAAAQRKGLVRRAQCPDDRRRSIVTASAEGRRRMARTSTGRRRRTAELLADWGADDLQQLARTFCRYNAAVARHYLTSPGGLAYPADPIRPGDSEETRS